MNQLNEGNVYNVQQAVTSSTIKDASKVGLDEWSRAVRKELMQKLRGYSPEQVDNIIKTTFGDNVL